MEIEEKSGNGKFSAFFLVTLHFHGYLCEFCDTSLCFSDKIFKLQFKKVALKVPVDQVVHDAKLSIVSKFDKLTWHCWHLTFLNYACRIPGIKCDYRLWYCVWLRAKF